MNAIDSRKIAIARIIGTGPRRRVTSQTIGLNLMTIGTDIIAQPVTTTNTTMIGTTILNQGINVAIDGLPIMLGLVHSSGAHNIESAERRIDLMLISCIYIYMYVCLLFLFCMFF